MVDQPQASVFEEQATQPNQEQVPTQQQEQTPAQQQPQQGQQPTAPQDSVFADQLASITNERGEPKYKDLPTALDALKHSQQYIPQVKQENETLKTEIERLKAELEQRGSLEETVQRLTSQKQQPDQPTPQELQGLTPEQVEELLEQRLTERDQNQKAQANSQSVEQAIVAKYGDKAASVVQSKAQEFGMSLSEMKAWAAKSPKAVLALFEVKSSPQGTHQNYSSSVNIAPVRPKEPEELAPPEKSLLRGASSKDQAEYFAKVRENAYKRLGVQD